MKVALKRIGLVLGQNRWRLSALYTRSSTAPRAGQRCKHPTNPAVFDTHLLFLLESARVQDDAAQIDFTE